VTVYVSDGRVTLSGELETEADARAIAAMARRLPGVVDVTSTLHARP
jgi:osmotically-inducible protein OsmY